MIGSRLVDRYELTAVLGSGGMGVVYAGRDPRLKRDVAVKLIHPESWNEEIEQRFQREARAVARMDHPSIVPIFDFGRHQGCLFFVMPLIRGKTLHELIAKRSLDLDDVLTIAVRVAEALDYSHARGIVHRDVKPANVMVSREEDRMRVRIMDFGLALTLADSSLSGSATAIGTPVYLSPEQILGESLDGRCDLYSLGVMIYECLAGEPPFQGVMFDVVSRILHEAPLSLRERGVRLDEELDELVMSCLAKKPSERPRSGAELAATLTRYLEGLRAPADGLPSAPAEPTARGPLFGRDAELAELRGRLELASAGECQLVFVGGEAGIGKTRLLQELEALARAAGVRVLRSHFADRENTMPYQGFCGLVQDCFRDTQPRGSTVDLSDVAAELIELFPALSEIRELREARGTRQAPEARAWEDTPSVAAGPSVLFETLARTLTRLCAGRPMVLLLEQLHDAETSLDALRYAFHRLGPSPLLIVGTYRHTETDRRHPLTHLARSFSDDPRFASMVLAPLSAPAFGEMIRHELDGDVVDEDFLGELFEISEGNPFFALELTRSYVETGSLRRGGDGVWKTWERAHRPIPPTIQQTVEGRIERLDAPLRHVLRLAAVLGRRFEVRDLEEIAAESPDELEAAAGSDLDHALDGLVSQGLLEEDRSTRGDWMSFSSGVVREVLYRSLTRRRRKWLHHQHARNLEKRHAGRLERVYPRLLHHCYAAEMPEETVDCAIHVARLALEAWSPGDAIKALETALELVDELSDRVAAEGELRGLLARAYRAAGDHDRALGEAAKAAKAFKKTKSTDKVVAMAVLAAETAWHVRRVDDVKRWVEKGLALARRSGTLDVMERLLNLGATVANLGGEYTAARKYLEEAERIGASTGPLRILSLEALLDGNREPIRSGGTLVCALRTPVVNLEPGAVKTFEEQEVAANVFETIVATDADGNLVPWMCQEWKGSADTRIFDFRLRTDVYFSDGRPLLARHVKASLERSAQRRAYSPPLALVALEGLEELLSGEQSHVRGIEAHDESRGGRLRFRLVEPLPIFPAMLTDAKTSISRVSDDGALLGTGPFRIVSHDAGTGEPGQVVLERNPAYWRGPSPNVRQVRFLTSRGASEIISGLRSGEIDLARDLKPDDFEVLLREATPRHGWAEATTKNVYFLLFNDASDTVTPPLRRALIESLRVHDLVWRTLGRFAQPASSLIPPGVFGHDPGRRRKSLRSEEARRLARGAGVGRGVTLRAAIHPVFQDRFAAFLDALRQAWSHLGVEIVDRTPTMKQFISHWAHNEDVDLLLGRWNGDYEDPDSYTYSLFHSRHGVLRLYFSAPESDALLERARRARRPGRRRELYRQLEDFFEERHVLTSLFYDTDYRLAGPRVQALRLSSSRPFVNYCELGKSKAPARPRPAEPTWHFAGEVHVPIASRIFTLDPLAEEFVDYLEVTANVFEPLTRIDVGAHAVAGLARSYESLEGGLAYRFMLPPNVRFHDGRRLTTRDVRYTYERALRRAGAVVRHLLMPIRGAAVFSAGEASEVAGLKLVSADELVVELERPLALFPALLAHGSLAVVPEGVEPEGTSWRDGLAGTGPFRVVGFVPGERLELERNPHYRRPDLPRSERLVFTFGVASDQAVDALGQGRYSLASHLRADDLETLRRQPELAQGGREAPCLSTFFIAFNSRRGLLAERRTRLELAGTLDVAALVETSLGRRVTPAHGLIPPGLLGSVASRQELLEKPASCVEARRRLTAAVHPAMRERYSAFWELLSSRWRELGFDLEVHWSERPETSEKSLGKPLQAFDLAIDSWHAYYPDADSFAMGLLHSASGHLRSFFSSEELDRLIEEGRWESDPGKRDALYRSIESLLAGEALLVPLFHEVTHTFCHPRVEGFRTGFSFPMIRYERLTIPP